MATPDEIRAKLRELGYLKSPLNRFVFGAGGSGGALRLALGAGGRGALIAGPLIGLFTIVLFGHELAADERLSWFLACSLLAALIVLAWVVVQALALHALARLRGRMVESLPAVAVILSGITFLLPALLWLLASRRIQSEALREGALAPLALATALLLGASATAFAATRAADVFALGQIEAWGGRRGWLSAILGLLLLLIITATLRYNANRDSDLAAKSMIGRLQRNPQKATRMLSILAVDGAHAGTFARETGTPPYPDAPPEFQKLCEYEPDPNLIAGWMKIQTGSRQWTGMSMQGLKAAWGGSVHDLNSAPGRLLVMLGNFGLATAGPLPGRSRRPPFFWEVIAPEPALVVGGWHTYPIQPGGGWLFSDRLFTTLITGGNAEGFFRTGEGPGSISAADLTSTYSGIRDVSLGWRANEFHGRIRGQVLATCSNSPAPGCPVLDWSYMPGMDIACGRDPDGEDCRHTETFLKLVGPGSGSSLLLIENPGRRGGTGAIWFRPAKDETIRPIRAPEEVAAAVLDYLGYPLAADLAGVKPEEAQVPTYGTVTLEDPGDDSDDATLKALKQLGYIQ